MIRIAMIAAAMALTLGPANAYDENVPGYFTGMSLPVPETSEIIYCHGFNCNYRASIGLGPGDRARFASLMAGGRGSAQAERRAAGQAIAYFQRRAGAIAGTSKHIARAGMAHAGKPGELDCIDESRNTTAVLVVLEKLKLLKHHRVGEPVARGHLIDLRPPHVTAILTETATGKQWAVDSWTRVNGVPPEILPLETWRGQD